MHAKDDGRICLLLQFSFSHNLSSCHTHKYYTFFFFFFTLSHFWVIIDIFFKGVLLVCQVWLYSKMA